MIARFVVFGSSLPSPTKTALDFFKCQSQNFLNLRPLRERERERERQTDRQTDRQVHVERDLDRQID